MARAGSPRTVQCYHCLHPFEISARAMTVSCPSCTRKLLIEDVTIRDTQSYSRLQTCGRVVVKPKGRIIADLIEAHRGVEAMGVVEAKVVRSGPVFIGPKAKWQGDCHTPSLTVKLGAVIRSGYFVVPDAPPDAGLGAAAGDETRSEAEEDVG